MEKAKETLSKKGQSRRNLFRLAVGGAAGVVLAGLGIGRLTRLVEEQAKQKAERGKRIKDIEEKSKTKQAKKYQLPQKGGKQESQPIEVIEQKRELESILKGKLGYSVEVVIAPVARPYLVTEEVKWPLNIRALPDVKKGKKVGKFSKNEPTPPFRAEVIIKRTDGEDRWGVFSRSDFQTPLDINVRSEVEMGSWGSLLFACRKEGDNEPYLVPKPPK